MSMRRRLLVWLLTSVLLGGFVAAGVVFYQARAQSTEFFDYQLRQLALTLRDRDYSPSQLAEALQGQEELDFAIQVWGPDGRRLYGTHPHLDLPAPASMGFTDASTPSGRWRVFSIWHRGLTIQVAQHKLAREALAIGAALRTLLPFVLALPLMGLLIWKLVGREVRFLETTAQAVARRSPDSLEPIEGGAVPDEIRPLVDSLNGLLARLGGALAQQRQFIADAAHELRTPLTALRLQLSLAQRATDPAEREKALATLGEGITRATHVVEQLLAMARAEPSAETKGPVDLDAVAKAVVEEARVFSEERGSRLGLDSRPRVEDSRGRLLGNDGKVSGNEGALRIMIENLVDNAIRYASPGEIVVRTRREGDAAVVEVEDSGPGIPAGERERVFDRFYRREGAEEGGSGLGLAIARRIAERHGGTVELFDGPDGRGLTARIRIPLSPA
jgi:two-component system OmpR family sensor kinase